MVFGVKLSVFVVPGPLHVHVRSNSDFFVLCRLIGGFAPHSFVLVALCSYFFFMGDRTSAGPRRK